VSISMATTVIPQDVSRPGTSTKPRISQKEGSNRSPNRQSYEPAKLSSKSLWGFFAASVVMIVGLQLDAFKHATDPNLETFFTIWHAIMYAGMALCGGTIAWFIRRNSRLGAPNLFAAIPLGFQGAVVGMAILVMSGGVDTVWHTSFGIEKGLEILVSPSHLGIITGMFLVSSAPLVMLWKEQRALTKAEHAMTVVSAGLAFTTVHIITAHASQLGELYLGSQRQLPFTDAYRVHGYVFSTVLLLIPMLALKRRFGTGMLGVFFLALMPAVMMNFLGEKPGPLWLPFLVAMAAALAVPVSHLLSNRIGSALRARISAITGVVGSEHKATSMIALGATFPAILWSAVFIVTPLAGKPVFWSVHVWTGVLLMTIITGALTAFGVYGVLRGSSYLDQA
jgi:hypothetical protein